MVSFYYFVIYKCAEATIPINCHRRGNKFSCFSFYKMNAEDKLNKASCVQSISSSAQSTPEKNRHSDNASRSPELLQEFIKSAPKKELLRACFDKDKKNSASSKSKMIENLKAHNKTVKKQESKKASSSANSQPSSRKQNRKGDNPMRLPPAPEQSLSFGFSSTWICKNSACRATLSIDDTFCKRCSCCICHQFDDNKDPSLWLVCASESGEKDYCGLSCHIECALQREKVGVVDLGQLMQLDGSYCCASCGKVSGILGCWKKQLMIAKDARRLDALCLRIYLSYRLLDGTSQFKELHEIVKDAKAKLEIEVGSVNGTSGKMVRGLVSRLSVASDVQELCCLAIQKADDLLKNTSSMNSICRDTLPAACKFIFEEVNFSSVKIILIELPTCDTIKGYKLWYWKSREKTPTREPIEVFPRTQRRIMITNLQPCTEYTFRIISYTETGDLGHSEAKCFTKSVEVINKNLNSTTAMKHKKTNNPIEGSSSSALKGGQTTTIDADECSGFRVRELEKVFQVARAQENGCLEGFCSVDVNKCCEASQLVKSETGDMLPTSSPAVGCKVISVPDLNVEVIPPFESSRDEHDGFGLGQAVEADDDAASNGVEKNGLVISNGSGDSQAWPLGPHGEVGAVDSKVVLYRKRAGNSNEEMHDCDSTLANGSSVPITYNLGCFDNNYEYCVKVIRWLECEGHITSGFRLRLLTWFSIRSTEQERRVVNTFIQTLIDEPSSLAAQLVDSFSEIVSTKRPNNGFCNQLFH